MRSFVYVYLSFLIVIGCTNPSPKSKYELVRITGETMGTTYALSYLDSMDNDFTVELTELLIDINKAVSTYQEDSEISTFNKKDTLVTASDGHFARNFELASTIYEQTQGWFNPSIMPLVNYWGFGYAPKEMVKEVDSLKIDSLLQLVQFDSIHYVKTGGGSKLTKSIQGIELDFSAIAKGDAVDQVGLFLEDKGIKNYFVEIGGEVRARGVTTSGMPWRVGIRSPKDNGKIELHKSLALENQSLATSGNYENFHKDKETGVKYAHTINPHTGYPERNTLLSASVFAADCATADALATGFMAMGLDKAYEVVMTLPEVEAYFIYSDEAGNFQEKATPKAAEWMKAKK